MAFSKDVLKIDPAAETAKITEFIVEHARSTFRRRGVVVGLSGGIDSAVMASLAVQAMGKENVLGLIMPEKESNPVSSSYAVTGSKHPRRMWVASRSWCQGAWYSIRPGKCSRSVSYAPDPSMTW